MLFLLLAMMCFLFLVLGAATFSICGLVPPLRRFALSAALWCAAWGPLMTGWILLAGLALLADGLAKDAIKADPLHFLADRLAGWTYLWLAVLGTAAAASFVAWLHQIAVRRMTFALFRIYATGVTAGIGSVWGWALGIWIGSRGNERCLVAVADWDGVVGRGFRVRRLSWGEAVARSCSAQVFMGNP